jgi:hypothetical protein
VTAGSLILHSNVSDSGCGVVEILVRNLATLLIAAWTGQVVLAIRHMEVMCLPQIAHPYAVTT